MFEASSISSYGGSRFRHLRDFRNDMAGFLMRVARDNPELVRVKLGVLDYMFVSSPEYVHKLLVDHPMDVEKSSNVRMFLSVLMGDGLTLLEADVHKRRRRLLAPAFMSKRIASYADEMVTRANASVERMLRQTQLDVTAETMQLTLEIVAKTLFDASVDDETDEIGAALTVAWDCMIRALTATVPLPPQVPTPVNLRLRRAVRRVDEVLYRMIRERRQSGIDRGDLLSILLTSRNADDGSTLDENAVRDEAMSLFVGGHETTAITLAWALYLVAKHPEIRARLEREIDGLAGRRLSFADLPALPYTQQVIKETLRLMPPVFVTSRTLVKPITLGAHTLNAGQTVAINIIGQHRRADLYPDPDRFDPDRFSPEREKQLPRNAFLPFGAGPRTCIGSHFAMIESQLVLATYLQRVRFELLNHEHPGFAALATLRPARPIEMRVSPRLQTQPMAAATHP